jgi:hypothetical protein
MKMKIESAAEILKNTDLQKRRTRVGRARYDKRINAIILHVQQGYDYEIDLDRCQTAGACLDWIHQISGKTWGPAILRDFCELLFEYIPKKLWANQF